MKVEILHDLFKRALAEEIGIVVESNNTGLMQIELRKLRVAFPEYHQIIVANTPDVNKLFLVKQSVELEP